MSANTKPRPWTRVNMHIDNRVLALVDGAQEKVNRGVGAVGGGEESRNRIVNRCLHLGAMLILRCGGDVNLAQRIVDELKVDDE